MGPLPAARCSSRACASPGKTARTGTIQRHDRSGIGAVPRCVHAQADGSVRVEFSGRRHPRSTRSSSSASPRRTTGTWGAERRSAFLPSDRRWSSMASVRENRRRRCRWHSSRRRISRTDGCGRPTSTRRKSSSTNFRHGARGADGQRALHARHRPAHHLHVTEKGDPGFVGLAYYAASQDDLKKLAKAPGRVGRREHRRARRRQARPAERAERLPDPRWCTGSRSCKPIRVKRQPLNTRLGARSRAPAS
mgnify:CR=1 FL=1